MNRALLILLVATPLFLALSAALYGGWPFTALWRWLGAI